ncbi:hypothetical protein SUGI_0638820 [Cryptomeria japonica]|uniref:uncharacterized protein LOC131052801 n=1 Tax=Cryptomeria japonica TaxID=3369 RepID=UPI0024148010|nr:uncharacterized protein LOC131052801 [Cryptomeria japonica]GLJ31758.1 hypothetical protein SUGI_0638820 [Cryptomeria japonica]
MGNCIQSRVCAETGDQIIKVMRMDGTILEYIPPLLVRDLLMEGDYQKDHMLVHSENADLALPHDHKLEGGNLYHLIPSHIKDHKAFSAQNDRAHGTGKEAAVQVENGIRLKIVVSKQELKALLSDGCGKEKLVEQLLLKQLQSSIQQQDFDVASRRWRPSLEKIPEIN